MISFGVLLLPPDVKRESVFLSVTVSPSKIADTLKTIKVRSYVYTVRVRSGETQS